VLLTSHCLKSLLVTNTHGFFVDFAAIENGSQKASELLWASIVHRVHVHATAEQSEGH
jgi:hypothetical protein